MHGQHREDTKQKRHMWSEPLRIPTTEADSTRLKSFCKGGRKIAVGATALFQAGDALPFIGIIRKVSAEKDGALKLCVNWLYRPGDIELAKGAFLEAAPNEIFYSFHKDEISAASLLHPCKVAFLPKGVELPSTVSHFVCRRVYDTSNKCLYWLTDQDYTDEHQGEVNRLLNKTKHEMQAGAHPERPAQRALSELTSPKRETVNVALSSQGKSKKRERTEQLSDSSKREKHTMVEEDELKCKNAMKFEDFAVTADKEVGLTSMPSVDHFIQVMAEDRSDASKKLTDVVPRRILLAGIIAATEREDCLTQFVRLGGLSMLDSWLQEAHKGKPGEGEKVLDELLLVLLRALEKLPVDLDALKTCNVGKSVNNLKNHKNFEVQKKGRKLVDTWKKRVNAEIDEAKSGLNSGSAWSRPSADTLTSKGCYVGGPKSSASAQHATNGTGPSGETTSVCGYKDPPETAVSKDNSGKVYASGASEVVPVVKEEKSCSSSQSQNNSQSWGSGSTKGAGSWKEEGKAHSVVSVGNKNLGTALRSHTKSHPATISSGFQKEPIGRHKTTGMEKISSGALSDKKTGESARGEIPSSQRLIVRLPNPGRSPAHSTSGGCLVEGVASNNRGSSPSMVDKHDSLNGSSRAPDNHSPDTSGDTKCGNSATKFGADGKEEINRSCIATGDDVDLKMSDAKQKPKSLLICKSPPATYMGTVKKGSNSSVSLASPGSSNMNPAGFPLDTAEGGIDLLASVAACEGIEPEKCSNESMGGEGHPLTTEGNRDPANHGRVSNGSELNIKGNDDGEKQIEDVGPTRELELAVTCVREFDEAQKSTKLSEDLKEAHSTSTFEEVQQESPSTKGATQAVAMDTALANEVKALFSGEAQDSVISRVQESTCRLSPDPESSTDAGQANMTFSLDNAALLQESSEDGSKALPNLSPPSKAPLTSAKTEDSGPGFYEEDALEVAWQVAMEVEQEVQRYGQAETQEASSFSPAKRASSSENGVDKVSNFKQTMDADASNMSMKVVCGEKSVTNVVPADGNARNLTEGKRETIVDGGEVLNVSLSSPKDDAKLRSVSEQLENTNTAAEEVRKLEDSSVPEVLEMTEASGADKEASVPKDSKDAVDRPVFDLNEGFITDEGPHDRATHAHYTVSGPTPAKLVADRTLGFSQSSSVAAPIAVVSAMKGAFIPLENISRPKGEMGWKGSAATSAFRPAEPRRVAEALQTPADATAAMHDQGKQARMFDIDLNVADERMIEDSGMALTHELDIVSNGVAGSRPELDLNRVDESDESAVLPGSNGRSSLTATRPILDFDLNDGLGSEEPGVDEVSSRDNNLESAGIPAFAEARPTSEFVNVLPWYATPSSVPAAMVIPSFPGTRPDLPYSVLTSQGAKSVVATNHNFNQFGGNSYRPGAPMTSASVPYSATIPAGFSHAGFPFGAGFPFTSSSYSLSSASNAALTNSLPFPAASPSQLVSASAVMSSYGRPYLGGYLGEATGADVGVAWAKSGLDLNAGPEVIADSDGKVEGYGLRPTGIPGQFSYQQVGALSAPLKRKEPEGGFDPFRSNVQQMTWREL